MTNAPATFCRLMHRVLRDHLWRICLYYRDDVIVYAKSKQELFEQLHTIFSLFGSIGLKVKPSKCTLFKERISFLEYVVSSDGVDSPTQKIRAIQHWPVSYYRNFVKGFAAMAELLYALIKKGTRFQWTQEAQNAFEQLKNALAKTIKLAYPQPGRTYILDTDASNVAICAILCTTVEGVERPIAFFSRIMNASQRNYCPTRRKLLAVIAALQHFQHYLL